jgi:acyl carrier protein
MSGQTSQASEIQTKVNEVMHKGFEIPYEQLLPEAKLFDDLKLDSLDAIDMLVHIEDNLGVKVEVEKFQNVRTLGEVYTLIGEMAQNAPKLNA